MSTNRESHQFWSGDMHHSGDTKNRCRTVLGTTVTTVTTSILVLCTRDKGLGSTRVTGDGGDTGDNLNHERALIRSIVHPSRIASGGAA